MSRRKSRPYIMRGAPVATAERATVVDRPDRRVEEVRLRKLKPDQINVIRPARIDERLQSMDDIFTAWAATPGDGSVLPGLSRPNIFGNGSDSDILDEHQAKIVDRHLRQSPGWAGTFIRLWYRSGLSPTQVAHELSMKNRQSVYQERVLVLAFFLGRMDPNQFQITSSQA